MLAFERIGDEVARRWEKCDHEVGAFAEIATSSLAASDVFESVSLEEFARWFVAAGERPTQIAGSFGQPPINVYNGRGFYVELLFWVDTPLSIHQHAFSGAFGVLRGSSFHSTYRFGLHERVGDELLLGDLGFEKSEFLQHGDVRTIEPGDRFIHALLHLDAPSISIVVRTDRLPQFAPQYRYLPPGIGVDSHHSPEPKRTQLRLLRTLARTQPELFRSLAEKIVEERDLWFAFKVIELAALENINSETYALLKRALAARHAAFGAILSTALRQEIRQAMVERQMRNVRGYEQRFLFALLLNAPGRKVIDALIRARYPDAEPADRLFDWIEPLAREGRFGFEFDAFSTHLLRQALRGQTFSNAARTLSGGSVDPDVLSAARTSWTRLQTAELLQPFIPQTGAA